MGSTGNPVCLSGFYLDGTAVYLADSRMKKSRPALRRTSPPLGSRYLNNEQNNCAILSPPELSLFKLRTTPSSSEIKLL